MSAISRFFPYNLALPNMPGVAMEVMRSCNDDRMTLSGLAELIGKDPVLAAKVLRLANSARYSPLRSVSSLRDATSSLGMTMVRNLTLASSVSGTFPAISGLDRTRFWRHGIATAHYAVQLARVAMIDTDAAYLGGLLLRTGQLLMLQVDKAGVIEVEGQLKQPGDRFRLEPARWGCSHAEVTAELARRWSFPDNLLTAFHAATEPLAAATFSQLGGVLHLAEGLADAMDLGVPPIEAIDAAMPELIKRLRLKTSWLADKLLDADALTQEAQVMTGG